MDAASENVVSFLAVVSELVWKTGLYHGDGNGLWLQLAKHRLDPMPLEPGSSLRITSGSRPMLEVGVFAEIRPNKMLEFCISIYHDASIWQIDASVSLDDWPEADGRTTLRSFPTRTADTLDECLVQLREAAADLASCAYVLDEPPVLNFLPRR